MQDIIEACNACGGAGLFVNDPTPRLGLPIGWVQRCDACERYDDDLQAFNAALNAGGVEWEGTMSAYPYNMVDIGEATEETPWEQSFSVELTFCQRPGRQHHDPMEDPIRCGIDVANHGQISSAVDLEKAILENALDWLRQAGDVDKSYVRRTPLLRYYVYNCEPARPMTS